jgi:pyruvate ferredoxin oxidoreductase gamma subunit
MATATTEAPPGVAQATEIRWHARGGQGAKTASTFLAESAVDAGYFAQGFPEYGPERMGAPIRAFNRVSDRPIRRNTAVTDPDIVIVLDDTLLETVDIAEGAGDGTVFIINATATAGSDRADALSAAVGGATCYVLDANGIAVDEIGRPIPNTPMVGAMLKATGALPLETVIQAMSAKLGKKLPPKVVAGNVAAMRRAYEEVTQI